MVFRVFQFINHRHGVILHRNMAVAVLVHDKIVLAQSEFAGFFARLQRTGGREEDPVDLFLVHQRIQIELTE